METRLSRTRLPAEEIANIATHAGGLLASGAATAILVLLAALSRSPWHIVGSAVFGASLILLYAASTLYHSVSEARARARLRILDHCAIYVLIAGTYTPFTLGALRGAWGWTLFGIIWGLAVVGVAFKLFFTGRLKRFSTAAYVAMGWLAVIAAGPMIRHLSPITLVWLLLGGLSYTAGTVFYLSQRMRYAHAVWHVFVLVGSVCHAVAVGTQV